MRIDLGSPVQRAEIDAHWSKVRAGLHVPQDHVFDLKPQDQVHTRKHRINRLFQQIAEEQRQIDLIIAGEVMA